MKTELSLPEARRVALTAQGFADPRPTGRVDARHLQRVVNRLGLIQIDSVNVLARAHYLPFFSRLGPYPMSLLDDLAYRRRALFEYWGHAACFIPTAHYPLFRHRMEERRTNKRAQAMAHLSDYVAAVLEEVRAAGPLFAAELSDPGKRTGPWWGYSRGKWALELLLSRGEVAVHGRTNFARSYDLTERVFPADVLDAPTPSVEDAQRELLAMAARALGVGTARDIAVYYGLPNAAARARLGELVDAGRLLDARVEGWSERAYLDASAKLPRAVAGRALLTPFDPLMWYRERVERLFEFSYRIEIYVPEAQRQFGYYVLPFLCGERLAARVDLKADRAASTLRVRAAHAEPGAHAGEVAAELAIELREMARWLELESVDAEPRGDLAPALADALRA